MTSYGIKLEPSTLPDSPTKTDAVLFATEEGGSRNGERLAVGRYHVTVIDEDGSRYPGQVLNVDMKEDQYVFGLEHPDGTKGEVTEQELSGMRFDFVSASVVV